MSVHFKTLPSGIRVVTEEVPTVETVALGVWCSVGTRHEDLEHNGAAHMVEHMLFKGTPTRSAQDIAEQIENVGGHMNAYTSREVTSYHVHLLKEDFRLGMEIIADMLQRSTLPDVEIERERQVIQQEIGMTLDTPDDYVFDLYQQTAYPEQALGAPILGNAEIVGGMQRDTLHGYIQRHYGANNLVVSVAGNVRHQDVERLVEDLFDALPQGEDSPHVPAAYRGGETRLERETEQSHIVLGFRGVSRTGPDYQTACILSTLLGGGMSSRLFQEIRERRGLVYSIFALHSAYLDCGQFEIYAGTSPERLTELVPVLCDEIGKAALDMSAEELARAKAQRRSILLMSRESMMSRADRQAKHLVYFGQPYDLQAELSRMNAVDEQAVSALARTIFGSNPTLAAVGPLGQLEPYDAIKSRLAA
ncbi:MAG: insulinase family protein [Alphaproteobacteria bacterium]|nr:insulinase family protein [Alphaproteobacteria bacterium]